MNLGTVELLCFGFIILSALAFMGLERIYPYNSGQKLFRFGFWDDLIFYGLVQSYLLGVLIAEIIFWIDSSSGFSRLQVVSDWPIWAQLVLFLVTHDLYIYLFHRLQHSVPALWRLHEAHHSVRDVDWLGGVRSHPLEILINQTIEFLPLTLLGAAPEVAVLKGAISAVWGMFIHSNLDVRLGRWQYFFNGPEMHRWHHSDASEVYYANFSTKLAVWDWIFGTAFLPDPKVRKADDYGLKKSIRSLYPTNYFSQTWFSFRPFGDDESRDLSEDSSDHKGAMVPSD